jgi:predicted Fe-S protein YdhL (DUF1289 family)
MTDAARVPSPCISVCLMDEPSGWCCGCLRTLAEIAGWAAMADAEKRAVWRELPARRIVLHGATSTAAACGPAR